MERRALLSTLGPVFALSAFVSVASAQTAPPAFPDARASDPVAMRWMVGDPPPPERRIAFYDLSYMQFPQLRWSFSHWRELIPTVDVPRGDGPVSVLPRALRDDLDAVTFMPMGGAQPMTWSDSLLANYTDGIVVLHRGRIVYERYAGALTPSGQHIAHSVTKSFFGTLGAMLVAEGLLDERALVSVYLPELKDSAFGDATVRQVLDMTTAQKFSEAYTDPTAEIWDFARAGGILPWPQGYQGPKSLYEFLPTVYKQGEHGAGFAYRSTNAEVLAWLIRRVTGKPAAQVLQERIFGRLGAEQDAYMGVDPQGNAVGAGGLNLSLRDLARFGEMMRGRGSYLGRRIVPESWVDDILHKGDPEAWLKGDLATLFPQGRYRSKWYIADPSSNVLCAIGIHGQWIYVDYAAGMVAVKQSSQPIPADDEADHRTLSLFRALAAALA